MILTTHVIIFMGYSIKKQEQIQISVMKYMKVIHRVTKKILDENRPRDFSPKENGFLRPPPPPRGMASFDLFFNNSDFNKQLKMYDLEISTVSYEIIQREGSLLGKDDEWKLYQYKGFKYFYIKDPFRTILLKDTIKELENTEYIIYLTILLNIVFISFYLFLLKKLQPLRKLKNDIVKFSKGDLNIDTSCSGKDEISEVSNEFNNAINEIKLLTNSRNLFLRNIMHELKTPITKGLLISNMLDESKFKVSLKRAFFRLEYLLNEFATIEKFTSKNTKIQIEEFRIIDIIDHSLDILLADIEAIELEVVDNILVQVDFELFALALKNLLDNAIKYGKSKPKVVIRQDAIYIKNIGKALLHPIHEYNKPFNKKYENSNSGLGLGLYIVNHILKAHNLELNYIHNENENIFMIKFPKTIK